MLTVTNSTIAGNTANNYGGVYNYYSGTTNLYNTIVACNTSLSYSSDICNFSSINGYNSLSSFTDWTTDTNCIEYSPNYPLFVDAANGDYRLALGSQAIDCGNNQYAFNAGLTSTSTDVNGDPRFVFANIDIGAYEFQGFVVDTLNDSFDLYDGELSLREAITYAPEFATITFREDLNGEIVLTRGSFVIDRVLTIEGENRITINGNQGNGFIISTQTEEQPVVLDGLTIQGCWGDQGGAITFDSGSLVISNCVISDNHAFNGAGISSSGLLTIINSEISNNSAYFAAAIAQAYGSATIINCTITGNTASDKAGGIALSSYATLNIYNSIVTKLSGDGSEAAQTAVDAAAAAADTAQSGGSSIFSSLSGSFSLSSLTTPLSGIVSKVSQIPSILIAAIMSIVACCFMTADYDRIKHFVKAQFPESKREDLSRGKELLRSSLGKMGKAYGLIMLITFTEITVGLYILKFLGIFDSNFIIIIAILTAIVDIIPVLGTGTVVLPWALYSLIVSNYKMAIGLIVIYAIITVIRQIIEPKLVAGQLGLSPVVTITAMYFGLKVFGVLGMIVTPLLIIMLKLLNDEGIIHLWTTPKGEPEQAAEPPKKAPKEKKAKRLKKKNK